MKTLLALCTICTIAVLAGCTIKTADYTINQGIPADCQPQVASYGAPAPGQTGAGSTNSGGAGNTVIIIEDSKQDSNADSALGAYGGTAATAAIKDALSKFTTDMRQTDSNNPQTTNTTANTTNQAPIVEEEIAEPEALEDAPAGEVIEVD